MEEKTIDLNQLIKVEQLPKIVETLGAISEEIDKEIDKALALECNEESKTEVKKARANLNKIKTELEERRKVVKEQILKPYEDFEKVYNELVKDKLIKADEMLKERISNIEISQREAKIVELLNYTKEWLQFYHLEAVIEAKSIIPNITLTASIKSLKEQIKGQIERIANEITIIKVEDNAEEIIAEYLSNGYDYPKAKLTVLNRHQIGSALFTKDSEKWVPVNEETISAPVVEEELMECTFTVTATKEQLIQIKNYLQELGVKYE